MREAGERGSAGEQEERKWKEIGAQGGIFWVMLGHLATAGRPGRSGLQSPPCKGERCSASDSQNPAMVGNL